MAKYIVSYDLASKAAGAHSAFLEAAEVEGWSPWIWGPNAGKWLRLPETTLIGSFSTNEAAKDAFNTALKNASSEVGSKITAPKYIIIKGEAVSYASDIKSD